MGIVFGKKGSSAEECATATQNAQLSVRQDYLFGEMDAPRAITEEEKKHSVFQAIRMARANKKLAGGRAKRAREAEEAAKQAAPKKEIILFIFCRTSLFFSCHRKK